MEHHSILEKQIRKFLTSNYQENEELQKLLETISKSYHSFERDKKIADHAFEISEKEYQNVNADLQAQIDIRKSSIIKLKYAIRALDDSETNNFDDKDEDLINIINFLEIQIKKSKQLEAELILAKETAEKASRAKSEFLSIMSHEIRTPLNAIIGTNNLLHYQDPLPSQKELLNVMKISSENLLSLINDVLDYGKLEEGKIILAERDMNLKTFVKNLRAAHRIRAEEKGNNLRLMYDDDIPDYVIGDDIRLGQILNNLVSNAIKFTKKGVITIEVLLNHISDEYVYVDFAIIDSGIGISVDKQEMIFDRFTQANTNITREYGGSGLGLTIIKLLLQLQNSDIYLSSEEGKGSKFYFTLGFKRSSTTLQDENTNVQNTDAPDLSNIHILLVEDVEFNIMVAEKMLQNWKATVDIANNGEIAVEKARDNKYDIILMDLQMPVMDGYTATRKIRESNNTTPIIALTASITMDIQGRAMEFGMNDCITKPFNPNDLISVILKYAKPSA
jgi:signal transduction histidine kinase/ActR/RegA family two-component response regulator